MTPSHQAIWRRRLSRRGVFLAWSSALGASLAATSPWHDQVEGAPDGVVWVLGLASHWQWVYLVVGLVGVALAATGRRLSVIAAAGLVLGSWWLQLPAAASAASAPSDGRQSLSVATVNLNFDNHDLVPLLEWLGSPQAPDVVVMQELTPQHQQVLDIALRPGGALARYVHRTLHAQHDQFGLGVLSRWAFDEVVVVPPALPTETLKLRLKLRWQEQTVLLTAVHPMPPISPAYAQARNASLKEEAQQLAKQDLPGILAGDFNDTPWSAGMRALRGEMWRASGLLPTWPNAYGFASVLPVDHILVTRHWQRSTTATGPDVGSDHRPVLASMVLAP